MSGDKDAYLKTIDKEALSKLTPRERAYVLMRVNGHNITESYKLTGGKGKSISNAGSNLERKIKSKSVVNPRMVKLAHTAIQETLEMKPLTTSETVVNKEGKAETIEKNVYPSHANRLDAAKLILSRSEPEIQKHMNLNVDVKTGRDLIDLSGYLDNEPEEIHNVDVSEVTQNSDVSKDVESDPIRTFRNPLLFQQAPLITLFGNTFTKTR